MVASDPTSTGSPWKSDPMWTVHKTLGSRSRAPPIRRADDVAPGQTLPLLRRYPSTSLRRGAAHGPAAPCLVPPCRHSAIARAGRSAVVGLPASPPLEQASALGRRRPLAYSTGQSVVTASCSHARGRRFTSPGMDAHVSERPADIPPEMGGSSTWSFRLYRGSPLYRRFGQKRINLLGRERRPDMRLTA